MNLGDPTNGLSHVSDKELKRSIRIYSLMNSWLSGLMTSFISWTQFPLKLGFVRWIIKKTIYEQFVGGEDLQELDTVVSRLGAHRVKTIIDFAKEADHEDIDLNEVSKTILETLEYASAQKDVFGICLKITAFLPVSMLEKISSGATLLPSESEVYAEAKSQLFTIGEKAEQAGVSLFIDAEESWLQVAIDNLAISMMEHCNRYQCIIYNTYQMYRKDRYKFLKNNLEAARSNNYILGAKVVRGAYMDKERKRALALNYANPIHKTKANTDKAYNDAITLISENKSAYACVATHNIESCQLALDLVDEHSQRFSFSQLYGMSDALTYNIAKGGLCATKYLPFGSIKMVVPYLIRRVQENKSMNQEMGRELAALSSELKRRKTSLKN